MKSSIISMIIVLVIMIVVPMIFLGDNELADQLGLKKSGKSTFDGKPPTGMTNVVTDRRVEVYKWVDEHGITQFSETPPKLGGESQRVVLEPDTNIMDPIKIPDEEPVETRASRIFNVGGPLASDGMQDMLDQSAGLEEVLKQQQGDSMSDQQKMIDELLKQK